MPARPAAHTQNNPLSANNASKKVRVQVVLGVLCLTLSFLPQPPNADLFAAAEVSAATFGPQINEETPGNGAICASTVFHTDLYSRGGASLLALYRAVVDDDFLAGYNEAWLTDRRGIICSRLASIDAARRTDFSTISFVFEGPSAAK